MDRKIILLLAMLCLVGSAYAVSDIAIVISVPTPAQAFNKTMFTASFTATTLTYNSTNCSYLLDGAPASSTTVVLNDTLTTIIPDITITPSSASANHILNFICSNSTDTSNKTVVFSSAPNFYITITAPTTNEVIDEVSYTTGFGMGSGYYTSANCSYFLEGTYVGTYSVVVNGSSKAPVITLTTGQSRDSKTFEVVCSNSTQANSNSVDFIQSYIPAYVVGDLPSITIDIMGAAGTFAFNNITLVGVSLLILVAVGVFVAMRRKI